MCTDDISSEMSSETLERILSVTLSEPMLESKASTKNDFTSPKSSFVDLKLAGSEEVITPSNSHLEGPNHKKTKLDQSILGQTDEAQNFPSEQDIDNFLDQIHQ